MNTSYFKNDKDIQGTIAIIKKINGDGGHWGSFMNLCGDSMTRAAENVERFLAREYNKAARQK